MIKAVKRYIEDNNLISDKDRILIGVSGGADSVCLLCVLWNIYKDTNVVLEVVHINHGIRETAYRDQEYVKKLCEDIGVKFTSVLIDTIAYAKEKGISTEEAGRILRYEAFASYGEGFKIAVAHNLDDNTETMLLNMFRGTGLKGLTGIPVKRDNIIRPLLGIRRSEIEEYLKDNNISYMTDETNLTDDYTRNRIRHNVIPYITANVNAKAVERMASLATNLQGAEDYLNMQTLQEYDTCVISRENVVILKIEKLHPYIRSRVVLEAMSRVCGKRKDLSDVHVKEVLKLLDLQVGRGIDLPYEMVATRVYEGIEIKIKENKDSIKKYNISTRILDASKVRDSIPTVQYTKWFDYDRITENFSVRNRQEGDYIVIDSEGNTQKLKAFFVNNKIPASIRDEIPLIAKGSEIVWIIGYRINAAYKVTDKTTKILEINYSD